MYEISHKLMRLRNPYYFTEKKHTARVACRPCIAEIVQELDKMEEIVRYKTYFNMRDLDYDEIYTTYGDHSSWKELALHVSGTNKSISR